MVLANTAVGSAIPEFSASFANNCRIFLLIITAERDGYFLLIITAERDGYFLLIITAERDGYYNNAPQGSVEYR